MENNVALAYRVEYFYNCAGHSNSTLKYCSQQCYGASLAVMSSRIPWRVYSLEAPSLKILIQEVLDKVCKSAFLRSTQWWGCCWFPVMIGAMLLQIASPAPWETGARMLKATLFMIAKLWTQPKYQSAQEWINAL